MALRFSIVCISECMLQFCSPVPNWYTHSYK